MFAFDQRMNTGLAWLTRRLVVLDDGLAGWGWVADVHPNPQDTAEAAHAYLLLDVPVPQRELVIRMIESEDPIVCRGQRWEFDTSLDAAWRLRVLADLQRQTDATIDPSVLDRLVDSLYDRVGSGGWPIVAGDDPSIFATAMVLQALATADRLDQAPELVGAAWEAAIAAAVAPGQHCPLASRAYAVACLADGDLKRLRTGRSERAMRTGASALLEVLQEAPAVIEEETFFRGSALDRWRHFILPLALNAVAKAQPAMVTTPHFRQNFSALCDLQQMDGVNRGGFAIGPMGLVTSYATVQAIAAIRAVDRAIESHSNPGEIVEMLFLREGRHHTDPQVIGGPPGQHVIANSRAAFAGAVVASLLAASAVLAMVAGDGSPNTRRVVFGLDTYLLALAWYGYLAARFPKIPKARLASVLFAGVTAVLFPLLSLLI